MNKQSISKEQFTQIINDAISHNCEFYIDNELHFITPVSFFNKSKQKDMCYDKMSRFEILNDNEIIFDYKESDEVSYGLPYILRIMQPFKIKVNHWI
jgi:hypothetical protein